MTDVSDHEHGPGIIERARPKIGIRVRLPILICLHVIVCCASLVKVAQYQPNIPYDAARLFEAAAVAAAFSLVAALFIRARFSFGYFVGFYLYTMMLGFLWLNSFSKLPYDHKLAGLSAAVATVLFLLPALLIDTPIRQVFALSTAGFERLLAAILVVALATIAAASAYSFRLTTLSHIYEFRDEIQFPTIIRYWVGIVPNALLPFAVAAYVALKQRWRAGLALILMLVFYPITLTKLALFTPAWIVGLLALSWVVVEARAAIILSLFGPMFLGLALMTGVGGHRMLAYFNLVNIRMMATPSGAMDIYNDFFANHPLTHFCQVSILKLFMNCPYQEPLSVVMNKAYPLGNLNASLFATEGVASVGLYLAPLSALVCGFVIALGNRTAAGLPSRFILISAAILPQILLNVPLTTTLLSDGAALLFLLWYITPRAIFAQQS
jgi:hypothetical protein